MTTKELIDALNEMRKYEDRGITDYFNNEKEPRHETVNDDYEPQIDEIIALLSSTIPRDTATCPPTEGDSKSKSDGCERYVLAQEYKNLYWAEVPYEVVARFPFIYPLWTCVPEVTP